MILNLSQKCILSRHPLYKMATVSKYVTMHATLLKKYDAVVFQKYSVVFPPILNHNLTILLVDYDNQIRRIIKRRAIDFKLLRVPQNIPFCVFLTFEDKSDKKLNVGDILDLSAELTKEQKKVYFKLPELDGFSIGSESLSKKVDTNKL